MKIALLLFFLSFGLFVHSQNDFAKGYIIGPKNDTTQGEVKLFTKNELDHYVKVMFRLKAPGNGKQYLPQKIHGYGFDGKDYMSIKYYDMWVFMQVVCRGKIMFYEYKAPVAMGNDRMESMYFIIKGGMDEMTQIMTESKVKKQIKPFISDDKELLKEVEKEDLDYNKLVQLIERYNERNP